MRFVKAPDSAKRPLYRNRCDRFCGTIKDKVMIIRDAMFVKRLFDKFIRVF
jgi:hypothetical protein